MSNVNNYLNENTNLYVIYVEVIKSYDGTYRNALWLEIFKYCIEGKLLTIVKNMYVSVYHVRLIKIM